MKVPVPGLERRQILATAQLASALRYFLQTHNISIPEDCVIALGEGDLDTEKRMLTIHYDFMRPVEIGEDND